MSAASTQRRQNNKRLLIYKTILLAAVDLLGRYRLRLALLFTPTHVKYGSPNDLTEAVA